MRFILPLIASVALLCAATDSEPRPSSNGSVAEDPSVIRAKAGIARLQELVDAGALPRADLERAQNDLADAQDMAILNRTIYSHDLTEDQAGEMVAAAQRRLDRRKAKLEKARGLVDAGVVAKVELDTMAQEVDYAQKEYDLAVSRAEICHDLSVMARAEHSRAEAQQANRGVPQPAVSVRYDGSGVFTPKEFQQVQAAFEHRFAKPLPVSAIGETAVHRALGFDHRGRVDVAIAPDQPEGIWLCKYLEARHIPYFAFWHAVPGKATGAHIHIGPESTRIALASRVARISRAAD